MNAKLIIGAFLFVSTSQVFALVTEKIASHSDKIASIKNCIKEGAFNAQSKCGGKCNNCCQKCGSACSAR